MLKIFNAVIAVALFVPEGMVIASEMPDVLIKVGDTCFKADFKGVDLGIYAGGKDSGSGCLAQKNTDNDLPDISEFIESGKKTGAVDEKDASGEKLKKLDAYSGKNKSVVEQKNGVLYINGSRTEFSHLIIESSDSVLTYSGKSFRGKMEVIAGSGGNGMMVINRLDIEDYLKGMLNAEMSHTWPEEALKAQAVASRTYAIHQRSYGSRCNYHMESSVISQVYGGLKHEYPSVKAAVEATRGEVLAIGGEPVLALFHSCCGGHTRDCADAFGNSSPGLKAVSCDEEAPCPLKHWQRSLSLNKIEQALKKAGIYNGNVESVTVDKKGLVVISGGAGEKRIKPDAFRQAAGYTVIPSARFTADMKGSNVTFTGSGSGHAVGMCQYGAKGYAIAGWDYRKILKHYYTGAEILKMY